MATKTKKPPQASETPVLVALGDIVMDDATQSRTVNNEELIEHYAELYRDGVDMPPVDLFTEDGQTYYIGDGIHRCHAHEAAEIEEVWAIVHTGGQTDAQVFACGANKTHGLHRSNADKRKAVEIMLWLQAKWSNRMIADHVGVSDELVREVRKGLETKGKIEKTETRLGKDGKEYAKPHVPESGTCDDAEPDDDDFENPFSPPTDDDDFDPEAIEGQAYVVDLAIEADVYRRAVNDINRMKRELQELAAEPKHGVHLADKIVRIVRSLDEAKADIRGAEPVEICTACDGDGCKSCGNAGFVTRAVVERRG